MATFRHLDIPTPRYIAVERACKQSISLTDFVNLYTENITWLFWQREFILNCTHSLLNMSTEYYILYNCLWRVAVYPRTGLYVANTTTYAISLAYVIVIQLLRHCASDVNHTVHGIRLMWPIRMATFIRNTHNNDPNGLRSPDQFLWWFDGINPGIVRITTLE